MGKKKGKKVDVEKKAALQAKKEAKQEKTARKRISKQQKGDGDAGDDDDDGIDAVDEVLLAYKNRSHAENDKKDPQEGNISCGKVVDKPTLESLDENGGFPLPRANATLEYCADDGRGKKGGEHIWYFGGEYYDGQENFILDELLRFDTTKKEWKRVVTPPSSLKPPPRCAHSCVSYKNKLYVWGGELATADQYHHYRDLWKFDTTTLEWTEITARNPPSARSGHACVVWKNYMVIFGGFFEALRETKWYNDIHIFNLQTEMWMDNVQPSRLTAKPEPRSACNIALYGTDKLIVHGGFSKLKAATANKSSESASSSASETKVHTDAWVLHLAPILQQKPPTWERWISSTKLSSNSQHQQNNAIARSTPNGRAGTSSVSYKDRMLTFGGVRDHEQHHHRVDSVFYSDLMVLDIDRRKWFPLKVGDCNDNKSGNRRRRKQKEANTEDRDGVENKDNSEDDNADDDSTGSDLVAAAEEDQNDDDDRDNGWDLDMLRSNMFAFVDGKGNIVYEKILDDEEEREEEEDDDEEEKEEEKEEEEEEEKEEEIEESKEEKSIEKEDANSTPLSAQYESSKQKTQQQRSKQIESKKVTVSSVMTVNETTNIPEAVSRTAPLPRINAAILVLKQNLYILGGILEVGDREITLDDMWTLDLRKRDRWECLWNGTMHKQVWRGAIHDDDDSYISTSKEDGSDGEDDDDEDEMSDVDQDDDRNSRKFSSTAKSKNNGRPGLRQEITDLNEQYNLEDANRTPKTGESLAEFYARTSLYWNEQATTQGSAADTSAVGDMSAKERKRAGFGLAKERYDELKPVMERLAEFGL
jgi:N-acetylneuraminic acid mutarotase